MSDKNSDYPRGSRYYGKKGIVKSIEEEVQEIIERERRSKKRVDVLVRNKTK